MAIKDATDAAVGDAMQIGFLTDLHDNDQKLNDTIMGGDGFGSGETPHKHDGTASGGLQLDSALADTSGAVTFAYTFGGTPAVIVTSTEGTSSYFVVASAESTTGFTASVFDDAGAAQADKAINWIAMLRN